MSLRDQKITVVLAGRETGRVRVLEVSNGAVTSVAFSPVGDLIVFTAVDKPALAKQVITSDRRRRGKS